MTTYGKGMNQKFSLDSIAFSEIVLYKCPSLKMGILTKRKELISENSAINYAADKKKSSEN